MKGNKIDILYVVSYSYLYIPFFLFLVGRVKSLLVYPALLLWLYMIFLSVKNKKLKSKKADENKKMYRYLYAGDVFFRAREG